MCFTGLLDCDLRGVLGQGRERVIGGGKGRGCVIVLCTRGLFFPVLAREYLFCSCFLVLHLYALSQVHLGWIVKIYTSTSR